MKPVFSVRDDTAFKPFQLEITMDIYKVSTVIILLFVIRVFSSIIRVTSCLKLKPA